LNASRFVKFCAWLNVVFQMLFSVVKGVVSILEVFQTPQDVAVFSVSKKDGGRQNSSTIPFIHR